MTLVIFSRTQMAYPPAYMERTKLSCAQINHALPGWLLTLIEEPKTPCHRKNDFAKKPQKASQGYQQDCQQDQHHRQHHRQYHRQHHWQYHGNMAQLVNEINTLSPELRKAFSEWRRDHWHAKLQGDMYRQQWLEAVMWSAVDGLRGQCITPVA